MENEVPSVEESREALAAAHGDSVATRYLRGALDEVGRLQQLLTGAQAARDEWQAYADVAHDILLPFCSDKDDDLHGRCRKAVIDLGTRPDPPRIREKVILLRVDEGEGLYSGDLSLGEVPSTVEVLIELPTLDLPLEQLPAGKHQQNRGQSRRSKW